MNALSPIKSAGPASHAVRTRLGSLHVTLCGHGSQTVVFWPSIFTDHQIYAPLIERLVDKCRFVLIDGPGHGASDGPQNIFSMTDCAKAMREVLDSLCLERPIIGGTSWGGMVAAELALSRTYPLAGLALMNTPMEIGADAPALSSRLIATGARWASRLSAFRNGVARSFFSDATLSDNPAYHRAFHSHLRSSDPRKLSAAVRSVLLHAEPLKPRMSDITLPTLVIAGTEDAMYPLETQAEAALLAPNGHFHPVAGKHISVLEDTGTVANILSDFISKETTQ